MVKATSSRVRSKAKAINEIVPIEATSNSLVPKNKTNGRVFRLSKTVRDRRKHNREGMINFFTGGFDLRSAVVSLAKDEGMALTSEARDTICSAVESQIRVILENADKFNANRTKRSLGRLSINDLKFATLTTYPGTRLAKHIVASIMVGHQTFLAAKQAHRLAIEKEVAASQ